MTRLFTELSKRYRVCDYDRRNVGGSPSAPVPRRAADLTADAFDALVAAHVDGPYIRFGISMGGLLVRSFVTSHKIAGFVSGNRPGTAREWSNAAYRVMTPAQRAADVSWLAGDNNEQINANEMSRTIDDAEPPSVPHVIMISTERFRCETAESCGDLYRAFLAMSRQVAKSGSNGSLRILDGDHNLYVTNRTEVVAAIDDVASAKPSRR